MPSPDAVRIAAAIRATPPVAGLEIDEWRRRAERGADDPLPDDFDHVEVDVDGVPAEWAWFGERIDAADGPVVLMLHGGGFVLCGIATHRELGARIAASGGPGTALVIGYRRPPEHPFPAAVEDCTTAYRWLLDRGFGPDRIVIAGDSAGGNLTLATAVALRDAGDPLPAALVCVSPWTDLTLGADSLDRLAGADPFAHLDDLPRMRDLYLAGADPTHPLASPLFADLAGLPPTVVVVGDTETLLDDSIRIVDRARAAGVDARLEIVEGGFHTWLNHAGELPEADRGLDVIGDFLARHVPC